MMPFECPRGCENPKGGKNIASSIIGWKRHMTLRHESYTDDELAKVLGTSPRDIERGRAEFLAGDSVTDPAIGTDEKPNATTPGTESAAAPTPRKIKTDAVASKFSAKLNKFKKSVAEKVPKVLNEAIKEKGPEWQLSDKDSEIFAEAVENCFEVLDIDFQITPISKTLSNPLWVLLLPVLVLVMIFIPKAVANARIEQATSGSSSESVPVGESVPVS